MSVVSADLCSSATANIFNVGLFFDLGHIKPKRKMPFHVKFSIPNCFKECAKLNMLLSSYYHPTLVNLSLVFDLCP